MHICKLIFRCFYTERSPVLEWPICCEVIALIPPIHFLLFILSMVMQGSSQISLLTQRNAYSQFTHYPEMHTLGPGEEARVQTNRTYAGMW